MDVKDISIIVYFISMAIFICITIYYIFQLIKLHQTRERLLLEKKILENKKELLDIMSDLNKTYSALFSYLLSKVDNGEDKDAKI